MTEKKDYLNLIFQRAVGSGLCRTLKEFADLLGVNKSGLSSAMNGNEKNLTDSLVRKVRAFALEKGLEEGTTAQAQKKQDGVFIPESTRAMFENMTETIRIQAQLLAQYQGAASLGMSAAFAPKNFQIDGK